jgi:hypothetical protein
MIHSEQTHVTSLFLLLLLLLLLLQELVGIMAASKGLVLMAPPSGNNEARKTMAALLSAIKPKTKVSCYCSNAQLQYDRVLVVHGIRSVALLIACCAGRCCCLSCKTMAALLSAIQPKTKVSSCWHYWLCCVMHGSRSDNGVVLLAENM